MGWVSADALQASVRDDLGVDTLEDKFWAGICANAVGLARIDIKGVLAPRGYTTAQIEAWDDLSAVHMTQGQFRALSLAGTTKQYDETFINSLDMRAALKEMVLTTDDGATPPEQARKTASGTFADGQFSLKDGDMDVWRRNKPGRST